MPEKTHREENNDVMRAYLERTFFHSWRMPPEQRRQMVWPQNYESLELFANARCELSCKYCYVAKYGEKYFAEGTQEDDAVLEKLPILLTWLHEEHMCPRLEIFGGNVIMKPLGTKMLDMILGHIESGQRIATAVTIPSNMNFIRNPERTAQYESLIQRGRAHKFGISFSASIDGVHMDENRPLRTGENHRDQTFYDNLFAFCKKYKFGFHPMLYSNGIEKWTKNFLWFQEMYRRFDIPWHNLYLLEVRNAEWTDQQCQGLYDFIKWLVHWAWAQCGKDKDRYKKFLFRGKGFNILGTTFSRHGRGIGCSLQSTIQFKVGEMTACLCHRQAYSWMNGFKLLDDGRTVTGIEAIQPESYIHSHSFTNFAAPWCETCLLKYLCSGGCMGSQYETTGDNYTPIPTVCKAEHAKIKAIIDGNNEIKMLPDILAMISDEKRIAIQMLFGGEL